MYVFFGGLRQDYGLEKFHIAQASLYSAFLRAATFIGWWWSRQLLFVDRQHHYTSYYLLVDPAPPFVHQRYLL